MGDTTHAFDGRTDAGTDTTKTGYKYKDPDTCDLYTPGHEIATDFADVLDEFESVVSSWSLTADVVAGGCNGCTTVERRRRRLGELRRTRRR